MTTTFAPTLTASDRCDRCGAQAFIKAILPGDTELLFCAHHGRANLEGLKSVAVDIIDETDRLSPED